jgi:hypothetical protein
MTVNLATVLRSHAKFVAARCPDGSAVAGDMCDAADEIERLMAIVDKPQWQRNPPDKSGWWWFWYGDADCAPAPVSIMYSGSDGRYFASSGQLGWTRRQYVDDMPGYWMPLPEPPIQTADAASR